MLPGVTVEASSDALIEKVRTATTDGAGRYTIVDLRPGIYTVTFTLPGFSTVRRQEIELTGAATVQVNGDLRVGALEETVTVTGETPVVDVQSVRREFVVNKDMMEALPVGRSLTAQIVLIAGVTGQNTAGGVLPTVHGSSSSETYMYNDGMRAGQHLIGAGIAQGGWAMSEAASSELTYETGAQSAEFQVGGVAMNAIPKEGGNRFSGTFVGYGAGSGVQGDNRTEELKQVIRDANRLIYTAEIDTAVGGPIVKDKLWFFGGTRATRSKNYVADVYYPDGSQAFAGPHKVNDFLLRLTTQLTPRNKLRISYDQHIQHNFNASVGPGVLGSVSGGIAPEASYNIRIPEVYAPQIRWTSPVTSRLFVEAGFSMHYMHWRHEYNHGRRTFRCRQFGSDDRLSDESDQLEVRQPLEPVQRDRLALVRDRLAQLQGRLRPPSGIHGGIPALQRRHVAAHVRRRRGELSDRVEHPDVRARQPECRLRHLRPGSLDAEQADGQPRCSLRSLQCLHRAFERAGRTVRAGAELRGNQEHPELERLGDSLRRCLRSVRRWKDGDQGQREQVRRRRVAELDDSLQPDGVEERVALMARPGWKSFGAGRLRQRSVRGDRACA